LLNRRAKVNKLKPEEFLGGTFTISNLGMFGIGEFSAVINAPQACILAVGGGISTVVPGDEEEQEPQVATVMTARLSADRNIVDEATAAAWMQTFKSYTENPKTVVL